jgi:hypothetical protein
LNPKSPRFSCYAHTYICTLFAHTSGLPEGQTKNPNLGNFWKVLKWKVLVYRIAICYILWPFGIYYGHFVYFVVVWYIFSRFGRLYEEKSGSTATLYSIISIAASKIVCKNVNLIDM